MYTLDVLADVMQEFGMLCIECFFLFPVVFSDCSEGSGPTCILRPLCFSVLIFDANFRVSSLLFVLNLQMIF